jgi:hypothetical protein
MKHWIAFITGKKEVKQAIVATKLIAALKAFDDDLKWRHEHNDNRNVRLYAASFREALRLHLKEKGLDLNDLYFDKQEAK